MSLRASYRRLSRPARRLIGVGAFACVLGIGWLWLGRALLTRWLIDAVNRGDTTQVRRLLRWGANPNQSKNIVFWDADSMTGPWTALDLAAWQGRTDLARLFIVRGADVNRRDLNGNTALIWAMRHGGPSDTIPFLLAHGADVHVRDDAGNNLLCIGVFGSIGRQMELLFGHGLDINAKVNNDCTIIEQAVNLHYVEETRILLEHGADWKYCAKPENCAWLTAAKSGQTPMLKLLFEHGADVNAPLHGTTPLAAAATGGHVEATQFLLSQGANPNIKTGYKHTLLTDITDLGAQWSTRQTKWNEIAMLLRMAGAK